MIIGVLALQGSIEHLEILKQLDVKYILVKNKNDLKNISGLIIPGGESSVLESILLKDKEFLDELKNFICKQENPVFGTGAGAILLCRTINTITQIYTGLIPSIDCEIIRNVHGSQINSFTVEILTLKQ